MEIEEELGYRFKDRKLLNDALTHKSFYHENPDKGTFYNERLELLGDTVLGLVIAELLYRIEPPLLESEMSRIKSYLVSGRVLAKIAKKMELGSYLNLGKGEIATGGRTKVSILSDTTEALFGAVFIDSGFEDSKNVILRLYKDIVDKTLEEKKYIDYKTELQVISQSRFGVLPLYRVIREEGLEHKKIFTVEVSVCDEIMGICTGTSKKKAEVSAAREALEKLKDNDEPEIEAQSQ